MRLLIISDSHKRSGKVDSIIRKNPDATDVFFLGDIVSDIEDMRFLYPDRNFHIVSGNCDYGATYKTTDFDIVGDKKILFCHGHTFGVKSGDISSLKKYAKDNNCDIVFYGHTHIASIEYDDGLYIVNPGSISCAREGCESYAIVDILPSGVLPQIINV